MGYRLDAVIEPSDSRPRTRSAHAAAVMTRTIKGWNESHACDTVPGRRWALRNTLCLTRGFCGEREWPPPLESWDLPTVHDGRIASGGHQCVAPVRSNREQQRKRGRITNKKLRPPIGYYLCSQRCRTGAYVVDEKPNNRPLSSSGPFGTAAHEPNGASRFNFNSRMKCQGSTRVTCVCGVVLPKSFVPRSNIWFRCLFKSSIFFGLRHRPP